METSSVIAVTRAGLGDWLLFDSFEEADEHPLVQYGDVIMCRDTDFLTQFTRLELPWLLRLIDMASLPLDETTLRQNSTKIWARMIGRSARPTSDPTKICELIRRDRNLTKIERKKIVSEATKTETKKAAAPADPKPTKRKFDGDATITLLKDDKGVPYGTDNNPKRLGSKAHASFSKYKTGMTVDDFLKAGGPYSDIVWDEGKGFIKVENPKL